MARGPAVAGGRQPGRAEEPLHRGAADRQALHGRELLGEVHIVEARIPALRERHHLGLEGGRDPVARRPIPAPVGEPGRPVLPQHRPELPDLARGEPQRFGGLGGGEAPPLEQAEDV
jgi:hypothetical protein